MTRDREPFTSRLLYHAFKWSVVSPLLHTYWRGKILGAEAVPKTGAFLVVSNHASNFDPVLLSCGVGRPVAYMAKEELFRVPVLKNLIELYGAYPINRDRAGSSSIKAALSYLDRGWGVGVFLSGTRTADGRVSNPKPGAALIAAKAQVPVLPVALWGTNNIELPDRQLPRSTPITIRIGELLPPPPSTNKGALSAATEQWAAVINGLHELGS